MPGGLEDAPFLTLFGFFFAIVFVRTQVTYWLARVVTVWMLDRTRPARPWVVRVHAWLSGDSTARGVAALRRWGLVAVPASFLATGTKTVVNAAAGVVALTPAVVGDERTGIDDRDDRVVEALVQRFRGDGQGRFGGRILGAHEVLEQ